MKHETESQYVDRHSGTDDVNRWNTEGGYFRGLNDDGDSSSWVDAFKEVLPAVASVYQQREFNKYNLALINKGQPPISAQQYTTMQPAAAKVEVGPTADAKKWLIYGGIGLLALVGLRAAKVI